MISKLFSPYSLQMRAKAALGAVLFCLALLTCSSGAGQAAERYVKIYTSVLDFSTSSERPYNAAEAAAVIDKMKALGVSNLIITMIPNNLQWNGYKNNFKNFLDLARTKGVSLHLNILQTNSYTYTANHEAALYRVQKCVDFIKANPGYLQNPIKSIYSNIEPNILDEWRAADWGAKVGVRRDLMRQWLTLMESIRVLVKVTNGQTDLKIYTGIDNYYDSKYRQGIFPEGDPKLIGSSLDAVFVMSYLDAAAATMTTDQKFNAIIASCKDEAAATSTAVSLKVTDFASYQELMTVAGMVDAYFQASGNYRGVAFFKYETLKAASEL